MWISVSMAAVMQYGETVDRRMLSTESLCSLLYRYSTILSLAKKEKEKENTLPKNIFSHDSRFPLTHPLHFRFWEMLAYLANTLIFLLVGVAIVEKASDVIEEKDWLFIFVAYCGAIVIR